MHFKTFLCMIVALTNGNQVDIDLVNKYRECINQTKRSSQQVETRFSDIQVAVLCEHKAKWLKAITRLADIESATFLTTNQRVWLNSIYSCADLRLCHCEAFTCYPLHREKREPMSLQLPRRKDLLASRKEYRMLSEDERQRFHNAMNDLKYDLVDNYSKYDLLTLAHSPTQAPGAHFGPAFLPWHREFLRQLETALRFYDATVAVPYWDSTLEQGLPDPRHSIIWSKKFFGNGEDVVKDGPYGNWTFSTVASQPGDRLLRHVGSSRFGTVWNNADVETVLAKSKFDELTGCSDPFFEMMHGTVHMWIGGTMADIPISPNDPVFYLHHAFVDHIWQTFRSAKQSRSQRESDYPDQNSSCNTYHYADAPMLPFPLKNIDGLSNRYTDEIYSYENRPTCSALDKDCGSPFLFCNTLVYQCTSKIVPGGNCTGFESVDDVCIDFQLCTQGRCQISDSVFPPGPPGGPVAATSETPSVPGTDAEFQQRGSLSYGHHISAPPKTCPCECIDREFVINNRILANHSQDISTSDNAETSTTSSLGFDRWFTVSVIRKDTDSVNEGVPGATVNIETVDSSLFNYNSTISLQSDYPYYFGAAILKIGNTINNDQNRPILSKITVLHERFVCRLYCYTSANLSYVPCSNYVSFNTSTLALNATMPTYPSERLALTNQWQGRIRIPNYLTFFCYESPGLAPTPAYDNMTLCQFLKFENSNLVGFARQTLDNVLLTTCKSFCRKANDDFGFNCSSLTFAPNEEMDNPHPIGAFAAQNKGRGTCVLNTESRLTKPQLFIHEPSFIYMEMICEFVVTLEN